MHIDSFGVFLILIYVWAGLLDIFFLHPGGGRGVGGGGGGGREVLELMGPESEHVMDIHIYIYICMYVCMYVCSVYTYVCKYVCTYVCM